MIKPIIVALMLIAMSASAVEACNDEKYEEVKLCEALGMIESGIQMPIVVSGIYTSWYFYDPEDVVCNLNVQSSACVKLSPGAITPEEFSDLLQKHNRVRVKCRGILFGPKLIEDDSSLPVTARLAASNKSRYCSRHYRTKLVVEEIISCSVVSEEFPWDSKAYEQNIEPDLPFPIEMDLPDYPRAARALGVEGSVYLKIMISDGNVDVSEVFSGDPILIEETIKCVKTWKFPTDVIDAIDTEFVFRLEKRKVGQSKNPEIILKLPKYLEVVGPSDDW